MNSKKHSAVKALGVAVLGAAFAAAGAGAADAAPAAATPDPGQVVNTASTLPAANLAQTVPGAGDAMAQGQNAVATSLNSVQPMFQQLLAQAQSGPAAPVAALLGGLPTQGLPAQGLPVNGLPLT